jgi:hypothetical protein
MNPFLSLLAVLFSNALTALLNFEQQQAEKPTTAEIAATDQPLENQIAQEISPK